MTERLSNTELGAALGVSHASVSRIRSGDRLPSITVMSRIHQLTGWTMDEQTACRQAGTYAEGFEKAFGQLTPDNLVPAQRAGE